MDENQNFVCDDKEETVKKPEAVINRESETVTYVVDRDTFELGTGQRVRLFCIDTPERRDYYYKEARYYLKSLVLNKKADLIKDVSETGRYGRLLRYVYVGDILNYELVKRGLAEHKRIFIS